MEEHFFLHFKAINQAGERNNKLLYFRESEMREAEAYIQDWLTTECRLNCISEAEAEKIKTENGGLPGGTFVCPAVTVPADLEKYNEQHDLLVEAIYDVATARKFKNATMSECNLDFIFNPMSDEMSAVLTGITESFDPRYGASVDLDCVMRFVNQLLSQGGLSKY